MSAAPPYRVELCRAGDVRAELVGLWADNLPVHGDLAAKLRWYYEASPAGPADILLLRDASGHAVGCVGIGTRQLGAARAALLADFAIARAHRTGFAAVMLQRAVKRHARAGWDVAYGFPNANAVAVMTRAGYRELGKMARYVRVLRHAAYVARRGASPIVARAAGVAIDHVRGAVDIARAVPHRARHALRWVTELDARFDALWAAVASHYPLACARTGALLRWRFLEQPGAACRIATLVERRTGALTAYAVVRGEPGALAEIADLFGASDAAIGALLRLLVRALWHADATAVSMRFLGAARIPRLLEARGFVRRADERVVIVDSAAPIADADGWYLTDLDEDT